LIGHIDRSCDTQLEKGATQQFSKALRFIPEKRKFGEESRGKFAGHRPQLPWRSSRGRDAGGSGSWGSSGRRGSDSWHKSGKSEEVKGLTSREEPEVSSPLKEAKSISQEGGSKKALFFDAEEKESEKVLETHSPANQVNVASEVNEVFLNDDNSTMQGVVVEIILYQVWRKIREVVAQGGVSKESQGRRQKAKGVRMECVWKRRGHMRMRRIWMLMNWPMFQSLGSVLLMVLWEPMKLLAWNCQGLGNAPTFRGLLRCQKAEEADVLFLSETKLDEKRMMVFKKKLGMANMEVVECEGRGRDLLHFGGEGLMWF
jgi:hypothetical protein